MAISKEYFVKKSFYKWVLRWGVHCLCILMITVGVNGQIQNSRGGNPDEPISVTANHFMSDSQSRFAEFKGDVKAVQGETEITCDELRVYYRDAGSQEKDTQTDSLEKITAKGHVNIKFDNYIAETEEAIYITQEKILILNGAGSKIKSGKDFIVGSKIIIDRNNGSIKVEGSSQKPVEAIFHPGKKALE